MGQVGVQGKGVAGDPGQVNPQVASTYGQQQQTGFNQAQQAQQAMQAQQGQLQQLASGQGPNPALAQLQATAGQNVQNQASLAASQRGASANPALIAEMAARQGASTQQQAIGQGATMRAQQQLAGIGALQNQNATMAQAGQSQQQISGNLVNAQLGAQTELQKQQMAANAAIGGGALQGVGAALPMIASGFAEGGAVEGSSQESLSGGPASFVGKFLKSSGQGMTPSSSGGSSNPLTAGVSALGQGIGKAFQASQNKAADDMAASFAKGGKVPARVSPGEIYLKPEQAKAVARGRMNPMAGLRIPGKANVKGDSLKNDTVNKTLDEGGVVVPRTKARDPKKASSFVTAVMAKSKRR